MISVMITMPHGKTSVVQAARSERVSSIKKRALQRSMPRLALWAGQGDAYMRTNARPMRDTAEVGDYIAAGSSSLNAHLIMRQRGGCFAISFSIVCILCLALLASPCTCGTSLLLFPVLLPLLFILPFCLL